jgi:hypothetical protein
VLCCAVLCCAVLCCAVLGCRDSHRDSPWRTLRDIDTTVVLLQRVLSRYCCSADVSTSEGEKPERTTAPLPCSHARRCGCVRQGIMVCGIER